MNALKLEGFFFLTVHMEMVLADYNFKTCSEIQVPWNTFKWKNLLCQQYPEHEGGGYKLEISSG